MLRVEISMDPGIIGDATMRYLIDLLPDIVSKVMSIPGHPDGELVPGDIEILVQEFGKWDVNTNPLEIVIHASYFPARANNLDERQKEISDGIKNCVPLGIKWYVCVFLLYASFQNFGPEEG